MSASSEPAPAPGSRPATPEEPSLEAGLEGPSPLERLASFRFTYVAVFCFLVAYVFSVGGLERGLEIEFQARIEEAVAVPPGEPDVARAIQDRVRAVVEDSVWTRLGARVRPIVLGVDGLTLLYAGGRTPLPNLEGRTPAELLPAGVDVEVAVSHNTLLANGVLVTYAALLLTTLYVYTRRWTRRAQGRLADAVQAREESRGRAQRIEHELGEVRDRLATVEPEKESFADEIRSLEEERAQLGARLRELERHEDELRAQSSAARQELDQERQALEDLLDEAMHDVEQRDDEMRALQKAAKRAGRDRGRDAEHLGRRLRTLYKDIEVDDKALDDLVGLGDESLRLKAEESLKRLSDEPETAAVRRKVGGLPPHLSIFEIGFAGKGRIYYTRGKGRRHRVLLVGAKNRQKTDLEYLSRLPKGT